MWRAECVVANNLGRPLRSFKLFLSENKCSLIFRSVIESPGDLTKDDIAYDLESSLIVIVCISNIEQRTKSITTVRCHM